MIKLCIIGTGGHAKACIDAIRSNGKHYQVVGLVDDFRSKGNWLGYKVLGGVDDIPEILHQYSIDEWIVAIGDNNLREQVVDRLERFNFRFATLIHSRAIVSDEATIDEGAVVLAGAVIAHSAYVDAFAIVNTGARLDHDSILQNFASLAPNAAVGGNSVIGRSSAVCIGASVSNGVHIGEHTVIGGGAVVLKDVPANKLAYGVPCCVIRDRVIGESYL